MKVKCNGSLPDCFYFLELPEFSTFPICCDMHESCNISTQDTYMMTVYLISEKGTMHLILWHTSESQDDNIPV